MKKFERPVMFVPEEAGDWKVEAWHSNPQPIEREVKNMTINFGPQHPAAHGVLRLVLELSGEVNLSPIIEITILHIYEIAGCHTS